MIGVFRRPGPYCWEAKGSVIRKNRSNPHDFGTNYVGKSKILWHMLTSFGPVRAYLGEPKGSTLRNRCSSSMEDQTRGAVWGASGSIKEALARIARCWWHLQSFGSTILIKIYDQKDVFRRQTFLIRYLVNSSQQEFPINVHGLSTFIKSNFGLRKGINSTPWWILNY